MNNNSAHSTYQGVNNLKVNNSKIYEMSKTNTRLVLNIAGHGLIAVAVANLTFFSGSFLLALAGGVVIVKTLKHAKKSNNEIVAYKKALKSKYHK